MKTILILLLFPTCLFSQDFFPFLSDDIKTAIEKGDNCLKKEGQKCLDHYEEAIELGRAEKDSSLAMVYKEITTGLYYFGNIEDCKRYVKKGLSLPDSLNRPLTQSLFYKRMANIFIRLEQSDSIMPAFAKSIEWAEKAQDTAQIMDAQILMADTYHRQGKSKRALEILTQTRPLADKSSITRQRIAPVFVMGNIYLSNKDYHLAKERFLESMQISEGKDNYMYHLSLVNWGIAMNELNSPEEVIDKLPRAISFFKDDPHELHAKTHLAEAYFLAGDYDKSLILGLANLKEAQDVNEQILISHNAGIISENYLALGRDELGLNYATETLKSEIEKGFLDEQVIDAYLLQAKALKNNGNYNDAIDALERYITLNDSLFDITKQKEVTNLQEYYEAEVKNAKIQVQQEEIRTLNEKAKVNKLTKGLYAGGMASALALFGLSVFGYRQRIKKNRIAREKREEIYKQEIEHKKKELASQTLHLVQKNTFLEELKENLENLRNSPDKFKMEFRRIVMLLKKEKASDKDWETFKTYFSEVHNDFDAKLKTLCTHISEKEIRLAAFLRMNLTTKEIATTMNVLPDSILKSKYRLKKKLGLEKETDLTSFLNTL
ncbi:tetratricopeptide repeat protein [Eudoraea adriatica]|uniref:tetratricopeptide repeat protein n=1 Tax=Eudoraea adriatica TaxID=446681 RepID=UPI00037BE86B|nr:tetratricopeptide repeat protein [Eudoraea adriatica]